VNKYNLYLLFVFGKSPSLVKTAVNAVMNIFVPILRYLSRRYPDSKYLCVGRN